MTWQQATVTLAAELVAAHHPLHLTRVFGALGIAAFLHSLASLTKQAQADKIDAHIGTFVSTGEHKHMLGCCPVIRVLSQQSCRYQVLVESSMGSRNGSY